MTRLLVMPSLVCAEMSRQLRLPVATLPVMSLQAKPTLAVKHSHGSQDHVEVLQARLLWPQMLAPDT